MNKKEIIDLVLRYSVIVLIGLFCIDIIYVIFTPLTIYPASFILKLFYPSLGFENSILSFNGYSIIIIPACIAGAAYYLLLILNLATPMKLKTRIKSLSFLIIFFLLLNIIRLVIFALLFLAGYEYFDIAHKAIWYFGSTILVVFLWFVNIAIFKIRQIPAYADLKNLSKDIKH